MNWTTIEGEKQIDTVGNIFQKKGGVNPKACQKCKKEFKSEIKTIEKISKVPVFQCKECAFNKSSGESALEHMLETSHKLSKVTKDIVNGYEKIIEGTSLPYINLEKNNLNEVIDISILCGVCNGSS